jgi:hypothetical protein
MKNVFLSYSRRDIKRVEELRQALIGQNYRPWIDPNPRPGQDWRYDIDDAIRTADAMIVVITPESASSIYVTYEWSYALGLGIPVYVVIFQSVQIHPRLNACETFDTAAWTDENHFWDYFLREFNRLMEQTPTQSQSHAEPTPQPNPANISPKVQARPQIPAYDKSLMPTSPGYWIVVRRGPKLNEMFRLDKDVETLGRDEANDITINDGEVSRYHLKLLKQGDAYALEDLGSTNGTQLNGMQVVEIKQLKDGDTVMLGDAIILSYDLVYST